MARRVLLPVLVIWAASGSRPAAQTAPAIDAERGPVVVELFTSQGCSSCPPADEVLSRLGFDERTRGLVVPLAFHVDYWNHIGWADPFSAPDWSLRQTDYCRVLNVKGCPYTPQVVVNGQAELNGSQAQRLLTAIDAARDRPPVARVGVEAGPGEGGRAALSLAVDAEILADVPARRLDLRVALFENGLVTPVGRGENGGRTLRNDFIVRRLETAFSIEPRAGVRKRRELQVGLKSGWKAENTGVAVFLQDPATLRIYAAALCGSRATATP